MRRSLFVSVEERLEIEKLADAKEVANRTGEYETLYDNLVNQQKVEDSAEKSEDTESDVPTEDEETGSDTDIPAMELFKEFSFGLEEYSEQHWNTKPSMSQRLLSAVGELGILGIKYAPSLLKTVYKGVLYAFGVLGELFMKSTGALLKYMERRSVSFDKLQESIASLSKALDAVKDTDSLNGQMFDEQSVINSLKISDSVDFSANIATLNKFTKTAVDAISKQVDLDIEAVKHTIAISNFSVSTVPDNLLSVKVFSNSLKPGTVNGYKNDEETTVSYLYSERLPSDVALMAFLPKTTDTLQAASTSYDASKIFLGFDNASFKNIDTVEFKTVNELKTLLKELKSLCDLCIAQKTFYEKLLVSKKQLRFGLQSYFNKISTANRKISIKESLVEYVYLKSLFIDKVYLASCIDIHDYNAKTIAMGLKFVEVHVKRLA